MMRGSGIRLMGESGDRRQEPGSRGVVEGWSVEWGGVVEWWRDSSPWHLGFLLVRIFHGRRDSSLGTSEFGCGFPDAFGPSSDPNQRCSMGKIRCFLPGQRRRQPQSNFFDEHLGGRGWGGELSLPLAALECDRLCLRRSDSSIVQFARRYGRD